MEYLPRAIYKERHRNRNLEANTTQIRARTAATQLRTNWFQLSYACCTKAGSGCSLSYQDHRRV